MPTKWFSPNNKIPLIEGLVLAAAFPFLLFPNQFVLGTLLALTALVLVELIPFLLKNKPPATSTPLDFLLLLFCLSLGLSLLVTADPDLTLDKAAGLIYALFFLRFLLRTTKSFQTWTFFLALFGLLGLGFVMLGLLNAAWINKIAALEPVIARLPNQIVAVPGQPGDGVHPNQIAGTLLFYFPLLWSVLLGQRWRGRWQLQGLWLGVTLLATAVLILTQSRSGWLGGAAAIYCLAALWAASLPRGSRGRRRLLIGLAILAAGGAVGLAVVGPDQLVALWQDPAQETAVGSFGSLNFRQELWRWTIFAIQDFPFTGVGLGSFRRVIRRLYPVAIDPAYDVAHAHNIFLHTAVDIGIPGLISYLALVGVVFVLGWQAATRSRKMRPFALGLLAGLLAFHVYGVGDVLALGSKTGLALWFLFGLLTSLHQLTAPPDKSVPD